MLEREAQFTREGWTADDDDAQMDGALEIAAACYAVEGLITRKAISCREVPIRVTGGQKDAWPWAKKWDKRTKHSRLRRLEIAGALIAAAIDKLLREN